MVSWWEITYCKWCAFSCYPGKVLTLIPYTEMCLAGARRTKAEDFTEDDIPSTSGRQFMEAADADTQHSGVPKVVMV